MCRRLLGTMNLTLNSFGPGGRGFLLCCSSDSVTIASEGEVHAGLDSHMVPDHGGRLFPGLSGSVQAIRCLARNIDSLIVMEWWWHYTFLTTVILILIGVVAVECFWFWQALHTPADLLRPQ